MPDFDKVDLTNCDREPIHLLGAIQPAGFLIAVSRDWLIARVSKNIRDLLGFDPDDLIGSPLADYVPAQLLHDLRNRLSTLTEPDMVERLFGRQISASGQPYDVAIHYSGSQIVIEAEPGVPGDEVSVSVRAMMSRLDRTKDLPGFCREGARQVRALLGYDRVMVYKFAASGDGEVVAEACKTGIGSFMGLHYPASDIPRQARAL